MTLEQAVEREKRVVETVDQVVKMVDYSENPLVIMVRKQGPDEKEEFTGTEYYRATIKRSREWPGQYDLAHQMDTLVSDMLRMGWISAAKVDRKNGDLP